MNRKTIRALSRELSPVVGFEAFQRAHPFPWRIDGLQTEIVPRSCFSFDQMLSVSQVSQATLTKYLSKIFAAWSEALLANDAEFLGEYCEELFAARCLDAWDKLRAAGCELQLADDDFGDFGTPVPSITEVIDAMIFRGLGSNRTGNGRLEDYSVWRDQDDMGMTVYTHKDLQTPENYIDRTEGQSVIDRHNRAVLRVLLKIKSPKVIRPRTSDGGRVFVPARRQTWTHTGVFETELKIAAPLKTRYKLETYQEWLYRCKMGKWVLVDVDNFMKGNPFFIASHQKQRFEDEVFQGSELDPSSGQNIRNFDM